VPSPLGAVTEYAPSAPEIAITAGIWAAGALIATVLIRIAISVRRGPGGWVASTEYHGIEQEVSH